MHHAFVSYARDDSAAVDPFIAELRQRQVPVWLDRRDIPVSVRWREEAEAGIRSADLFVICFSPAWTSSEPCAWECELADGIGKIQHTIDLATQPPDRAAASVLSALHAVPADKRLHTALTVAAGGWKRAHRAPGRLPDPGILRNFAAMVRRGQTSLADDEAEFLRVATQQRRRSRLRVWSTVAATAVVILLLCMAGVLIPALGDDEAAQENTVSSLLGTRFDEGGNPYANLASTAQLINDGQSYDATRRQLVEALSVRVPDRSWTVPHGELLAFAAGVAATPSAVTSTGATVTATDTGGSAPGPALRSLSRSATGRVQIRTTAHSTVLRQPGGSKVLPAATLSAVSADGHTAVAVTTAHARVYALPDTRPTTVTLPTACCTAAAISNRRVILGTRDGHLITVIPGRKPAVSAWRTPNGSAVAALSAAPDGRQMAVTTATDGVVRLLSTATLQSRAAFKAGKGAAVAFSPDSRYLAAADGDTVLVTDTTTGQAVTRLVGSVGHVRDLAWSPDSATVWAVAGTNRVVGWTWRTGTVLRDDTGESLVGIVGPLRDGRVGVVDHQGIVTVIDPAGHRIQETIATGASGVLSADWTSDGTILALGTDTHGVRLWRPETKATTIATGCPVTSVAFAPGATRVYAACGTRLDAYDPGTGRRIATAPLPSAVTTRIRVTSAGAVFVGDAAGDILTLAADLNGAPQTVSDGCGPALTSLDINPAGRVAAAAGEDANVCGVVLRSAGRAWHQSYVAPMSDLGTSAPAAGLRRDGGLTAFGRSDGTVDMWQLGAALSSLEPAGSYHESGDPVRGLTYTADGSHVIVATADGLVEILPGCALCGSNAALANRANQIVARARHLDLYTG